MIIKIIIMEERGGGGGEVEDFPCFGMMQVIMRNGRRKVEEKGIEGGRRRGGVNSFPNSFRVGKEASERGRGSKGGGERGGERMREREREEVGNDGHREDNSRWGRKTGEGM